MELKNDVEVKEESAEVETPAVANFVALGYSGSGKSNFLFRLMHGKPSKKRKDVIGVYYKPLFIDGIKLQTRDFFLGRLSYEVRGKGYYSTASGIIFMIDSTERAKFCNCMRYLNVILKDEVNENKTVMVVANKQDLVNAVAPEKIEEIIKKKCTIGQGITLFVMPMSVTDEDDHRLELGSRLFVKIMMKKIENKEVQTGLIPHAWETAEKELEDRDVDEDVKEDDKENDDIIKTEETGKDSTSLTKSIIEDPVHAFKSLLIR